MRALLRRRDYGLLWAGSMVSDAGDWLLIIALPVAVYALTGSALATSAVFLAELLPMLLLGTVAGVLIDRWDPRRALVTIGLVQAALLLPLLAVRSEADLWIVITVAAAQSTMVALASPAKYAILPSIVEPEQLGQANSLIALNQNLARLVGSPLGGLAYDLAGLRGVVLVDAASFVAGAAILAMITRRGPRPVTVRTGLFGEWLDGLRVVRRSRPLSVGLVACLLAQFGQGVFVVLIVVFVERVLHGGGTEVGLLRGVQAIGAVLAALLLGVVAARLRPAALAGWAFVALGVVELAIWNLPAVTTWLPAYVVLFVLVGAPAMATGAGLVTLGQLHSPPSHLGRVASVFESTGSATQACGVLAAGFLGDRLGLLTVLNSQGVLMLLAGAVLLLGLGAHLIAPPPVPRGRPSSLKTPT